MILYKHSWTQNTKFVQNYTCMYVQQWCKYLDLQNWFLFHNSAHWALKLGLIILNYFSQKCNQVSTWPTWKLSLASTEKLLFSGIWNIYILHWLAFLFLQTLHLNFSHSLLQKSYIHQLIDESTIPCSHQLLL